MIGYCIAGFDGRQIGGDPTFGTDRRNPSDTGQGAGGRLRAGIMCALAPGQEDPPEQRTGHP